MFVDTVESYVNQEGIIPKFKEKMKYFIVCRKFQWLVPDNTLHLSHTPPYFGTLGSLILDIDISAYSIYWFQYFFSLFYSTGEPTDRDKPWGVSA